MKAVIKCPFQVTQNSLYGLPMFVGWGMHELRSFVDGIEYIWSSNGGVLKSTYNASIGMWIGHRVAIKPGKQITF